MEALLSVLDQRLAVVATDLHPLRRSLGVTAIREEGLLVGEQPVPDLLVQQVAQLLSLGKPCVNIPFHEQPQPVDSKGQSVSHHLIRKKADLLALLVLKQWS